MGSTLDVVRRFSEHNRVKDKFTETRIPRILVSTEDFEDLKSARQREQYSKKMKSRKYKASFIISGE